MSYHNENCATLHNSIDECDCDKGKIESLRAKVKELESQLEGLKDPHAVWANMLRGTIAFPQHLKVAEARVHELEREIVDLKQTISISEAHERELTISLNRYQMDWATHTARIKELKEAMPDAKELRSIRRYLGYPHLQSGIRAHLESMADRIEKVMWRK